MKWQFYTGSAVRPAGWLRRQLELQAEGLSGNLDKVWPDIRDSAWIGGDREGWERVPYWLDGFIPLAYLLENEELIARAKRYMDAILDAQQESGWICPCTEENIPTYDSWAVQLISKVLVVYYEYSGDDRIPEVLYRVLKNYYDLLSSGRITLFRWGKARWFECFIAIGFLWERSPEPWLKELARLLRDQGAHYPDFAERWKRPLNQWTFETHIVNIGMMLKYEAVSHEILEEPYTDAAEALHSLLSHYNGMPAGTFTGDECLSGLSPIQGTELCAVVEQMYSYEWLFAATGEEKWLDRLETVAFNALPATLSEDMWAHQYDQMSNQIACQKFPGKSLFGTNGPEAHLFGLEPNYGCCTANFSQGWPKFARTAFLHRGNEILSALPVPSELDCEAAYIRLETDYPFQNRFRYTLEAREDLRFRMRVPGFARELKVNGVSAGAVEITLAAGQTAVLEVSFEADIRFEQRPYDLHTVKWGSLVFALPIGFDKVMLEYEKNGVERKFPYCDYEYVPKTPWNYGFSGTNFAVSYRGTGDIPFSATAPAVVIQATVRQIPWGLEDRYEAVCAKIPRSTAPVGEPEEKELYPYGCAKLRMTEMPLV